MDHSPAPAVNPAELARAEAGWGHFTDYTKKGVIAVIGLLILMAIFLL